MIVVFEGPDNVGKSMTIGEVKKQLTDLGYTAEAIGYPTSQETRRQLQEATSFKDYINIVMGKKENGLSLIADIRWDLSDMEQKPKTIWLVDRSLYSTIAYGWMWIQLDNEQPSWYRHYMSQVWMEHMYDTYINTSFATRLDLMFVLNRPQALQYNDAPPETNLYQSLNRPTVDNNIKAQALLQYFYNNKVFKQHDKLAWNTCNVTVDFERSHVASMIKYITNVYEHQQTTVF